MSYNHSSATLIPTPTPSRTHSPTPTPPPASTSTPTPSPTLSLTLSPTPSPTPSRERKNLHQPPIRFLYEEIQEKMEGILHEWVEEREIKKQQELVKEAGDVLGVEGDRPNDHICEERSTFTRKRKDKFELRPETESKPTQKSWLDKRLERLKHVLQRDQVPLRQLTRMVGNEMVRIDKMVIKKQPVFPEPPAEPSKLYELFASHLKAYFSIEMNMEGEERLILKDPNTTRISYRRLNSKTMGPNMPSSTTATPPTPQYSLRQRIPSLPLAQRDK